MTTNELISKLEAKIFDADMESIIRELYERLSQNGGSYEMIERDHAMAEQVLSDALTGVQKNLLARYQQVAVDRTQKAVKYGFIAGAASCIQIYHETINGTAVHAERLLDCWLATDRKFEVCVTDTAQAKECVAIAARLRHELSSNLHENVVSVACAWDERIHFAGLCGFYLGYRTALTMLRAVYPLVTTTMETLTLSLEHSMGLIQMVEKTERSEQTVADHP